jgi:hypothetical protein
MTSIKDFNQKIKLIFTDIKDKYYSKESGLKIKNDLYIVIMILFVGTASFGLGKLSSFERQKTPISILKTKEYMLSTALESLPEKNIEHNTQGMLVASKSGTKYYYPWCSGASRIKEENKIWFNSIEEARAKGLTPASNCTGLK